MHTEAAPLLKKPELAILANALLVPHFFIQWICCEVSLEASLK